MIDDALTAMGRTIAPEIKVAAAFCTAALLWISRPLLIDVIPAALAAGCAFMLPVAMPSNAIVYGSGLFNIPQMARAGLVLNLLTIALIPLLMY